MTTRTRRTPEQIAAYHQAKANAARAKAAKQARADDTRLKILVGSAVIKSFIEGPFTMGKDPVLAKWDGLYARVHDWLDDKDKEFVQAEMERRSRTGR